MNIKGKIKRIRNIILHFAGIISFLHILVYQLILLKIPASSQFNYDIGVIISIISQGIFSGWIIYILIEKHSKRQNNDKIKRIIPVCMHNYGNIYQTQIFRLMNHANIDLEQFNNLSSEHYNQINNIITSEEIFMDLITGGCTTRSIYTGLYEYAKYLREMCDDLLKHAEYLDDETFNELYDLRNCEYLKNVLLKFNPEKITRGIAGDSIGYNLGHDSIKKYLFLAEKLYKRFYEIGAGKGL